MSCSGVPERCGRVGSTVPRRVFSRPAFCSCSSCSFGRPRSGRSRTCCWMSPWRNEMRPFTAAALMVALALPVALRSSDKLTFDERVELVRGLTAEYATAKQFLPRSKKPLEYEATGTYDKGKWEEI